MDTNHFTFIFRWSTRSSHPQLLGSISGSSFPDGRTCTCPKTYKPPFFIALTNWMRVHLFKYIIVLLDLKMHKICFDLDLKIFINIASLTYILGLTLERLYEAASI